ncbi:MAG TPA: hypothetical protein DGH68_10250 [Bacteroidetes bacterium]|jgi:hypothetical protein|nr:hypothetical protein [Bacteroidota bacterium]
MNKSVITGAALITIGGIFLLPNFTELTLRELWPVLMLGPGILFFVSYFYDRTSYGLLMPGTILTLYGLLFLYCSIFGWYWMRDLWPIYLLGPGIGFFLMYYLGKKETGLLVTGAILTSLGVIFLCSVSDYGYLWPLAIIIAGVLLIFKNRKKTPVA